MATVNKHSKNNKISYFLRTIRYLICYKFCMEYEWNLGIQNCKNIKKSTAKLGHSDVLSVHKSNFALLGKCQYLKKT